jgi:hypothetical protein
MSDQPPPELSPEELQALEAELERITVDDVLLQTIVSLINIGARKAGLAAPPGDQGARADWPQVQLAIEGARALLPLVEPRHVQELGPVRDALSQLQMVYAQRAGGAGGPGEPGDAGGGGGEGGPGGQSGPGSGGTGPAQQSGRLWVPGQ